MAEPVREEYLRRITFVNTENTYYTRRKADPDFADVRAEVAKVAGFAPEEVALTRGATEALQLLITGYNKLQPGDTVLYADLDYDSMQYSMKWLPDFDRRTALKSLMATAAIGLGAGAAPPPRIADRSRALRALAPQAMLGRPRRIGAASRWSRSTCPSPPRARICSTRMLRPLRRIRSSSFCC